MTIEEGLEFYLMMLAALCGLAAFELAYSRAIHIDDFAELFECSAELVAFRSEAFAKGQGCFHSLFLKQ